jgi:hypothetical protein
MTPNRYALRSRPLPQQFRSGLSSRVRNPGPQPVRIMTDHVEQQHCGKDDTEEQIRVEKEFGVFFSPGETKLGVNSGSEKDASDQNTITLDNMLSQMAVNEELDKARLDEHRPPNVSKRGRFRADKTRSTRKARVNKRQLLRKFIRKTRLIIK